jgi:hypothetical protein
MMNTRSLRFVALLGALAAAPVWAGKKAEPLSYPFSEAQEIVLLPIVDARHDTQKSFNLEKLRQDAMKRLKRSRYRVSRGATPDALQGMNTDDLKEAGADLIAHLSAADDRWVMVLCLDDVSSKITFGSSGNAEMTGFLFDRKAGKLAWTNKGVGQAGQGGLMGMAMKGMMKGEALSDALNRLLASIPSQPK